MPLHANTLPYRNKIVYHFTSEFVHLQFTFQFVNILVGILVSLPLCIWVNGIYAESATSSAGVSGSGGTSGGDVGCSTSLVWNFEQGPRSIPAWNSLLKSSDWKVCTLSLSTVTPLGICILVVFWYAGIFTTSEWLSFIGMHTNVVDSISQTAVRSWQ